MRPRPSPCPLGAEGRCLPRTGDRSRSWRAMRGRHHQGGSGIGISKGRTCRVTAGGDACGNSVPRGNACVVKRGVSSWGAPGIANGKEALAGLDSQRRGRDWPCVCSSLSSFSVIASAIAGISHRGMEIYLQYSDVRRGRQPVKVGIHSLDMPKPPTRTSWRRESDHEMRP
jgi:hypothetical protein